MVRPNFYSSALKHFCTTESKVRSLFPTSRLSEVADAIRIFEQNHCAELRVIIESRLTVSELTVKDPIISRARHLFRTHDIWDTALNNGVLLYILVADKAVELLCDRGLLSVITPDVGNKIVFCITSKLASGDGVSAIVGAISELTKVVPTKNIANIRSNELPNEVLFIK